MTNLLPEQFTAGTTFRFLTGWNTTLVLNGCGLNKTVQSDDKGYITIDAKETSGWKTGVVLYMLRREHKNGLVSLLSSGRIQILPDISKLDPNSCKKSHNQRALDNINAVIENRASKDQQEYRIGHRELKRLPIKDLLYLKRHYENAVAAENGRSFFKEHKVVF